MSAREGTGDRVILFAYIGPPEVRARSLGAPGGAPIGDGSALLAWMRGAASEVAREGGWATYVVDAAGQLVVAPRRSEHVACAGGAAVRAAGEVRFDARGEVIEVTNNSTGYCPDEACWESVRAALNRAGLRGPSAFTVVVRFRRCTACGERNLVKEEWYRCALCDAELPAAWNFGDA